ncbi:MAG: hypothetical protein J1E42_07715, partial [Akkermansiaceae bacterium]|nr:hypothetical protein [Akkermansiaceae bacterium]
LAARLRPEAPEELREWLREHGANDEVRNTAGGGEGVVANSEAAQGNEEEEPCGATKIRCWKHGTQPLGAEFIESEGGKKLHEWYTEARKHGSAPMPTPDKKDIHLIKGTQRTIERIKQLADGEEINGLILTAQKNAARHMAQHDLNEEKLGYMQETFLNWDSLTRDKTNGQFVFTKDINGETCCLTATLGGKKWLVDGARKLRLVTYYTSRGAKTNFKKERRKKRGVPGLAPGSLMHPRPSK